MVGAAFCLAPSRQAAKTSAQTRRTRRCRPLASERDAQTTSASRRSSETPRPLRGSASLRETDAAARPTGLSMDRSASPSAAEDLAQSRQAAESSAQIHTLGTPRPLTTPPTSWRLGALAWDKRRRDPPIVSTSRGNRGPRTRHRGGDQWLARVGRRAHTPDRPAGPWLARPHRRSGPGQGAQPPKSSPSRGIRRRRSNRKPITPAAGKVPTRASQSESV